CRAARPALAVAGLARTRRHRRDACGAARRALQLHAASHPSPARPCDPPDSDVSRGRDMKSPLLWGLVAIQVAIGAVAVFYTHELTERLAWRRSQRGELVLHSVRNAIYAVLFLGLGWLELHGVWAMLVLLLLAAEVVVTLIDFVEEDLTRHLPASERVTHTLLALNYGAILVLLTPVLLAWAGEPSALVPAWYGFATVLVTLAAFGVAVFGQRDGFAARRIERLLPAAPAELGHALPSRPRVLIA